jgi:hypothetical protein
MEKLMKLLSVFVFCRKTFRICYMTCGVITILAMGLGSVAAATNVYDIKLVEMAGRPGHQGLFPIQSQPIKDGNAIVQARLVEPANNINLILRDASGKLLSKIPMIAPSADKVVTGTFFAGIVIPTVPFTMSVSGTDQAGKEFEEQSPQSIANTPQTFDVRIVPTVFEVPPDFPLYVSVRVTNYGAPDTFSISLASDIGGTVEPVNKEIQLATNKSGEVQFLYTAPTNIETGLSRITLTASVSSITGNDATNQATLHLPTAMDVPGKLTAWLSIGEQGMLGRNRKVPLTVWLCNDQIDSQSIQLANGVRPSQIKVIPTTTPNAGSSSDHVRCTSSSRLRLDFDPTTLIAALSDSIGLTSESRLTQISLSAYSTDDVPMVGYIPLVLEAQDQP